MPGPLLKPGAEKDIDIPGGGSDRPVLGWGRLAGPLDPFLFLSLPRDFLLFGEWELDSDGWKLAVSLDSGCQVEGEKCRAVSAVMGRTRVGCLEKGGWGPIFCSRWIGTSFLRIGDSLPLPRPAFLSSLALRHSDTLYKLCVIHQYWALSSGGHKEGMGPQGSEGSRRVSGGCLALETQLLVLGSYVVPEEFQGLVHGALSIGSKVSTMLGL